MTGRETMLMHLYATEDLIRQREHELHRSARRHTPSRRFHQQHGSVRHRAGWALIEIGLALVVQGRAHAWHPPRQSA